MLVKTLKNLERKVVTDEEETGANNLYLTLGTVFWTNPDKKEDGSFQRVRSPFLLVPVKLVLRGSGKQPGLVLNQAGDGLVLNICLMEKLRHTFRLSISALEDPESWSELYASGGVEDVFKAFLQGVQKANIRDGLSIKLESSCTLGLLPFGKLRMWLDLRDHWQRFMRTSSLVKHLIENPTDIYEQQAQHPTPEEVENADAYCPILYDGSQLEAVVAAGRGRSFVLQGPPGTGKSQTITNMLAHALAKGSRVLFVAEKRAALDVVKSRLQEVGLGPFCLDVHGKSTPKALREQLSSSLDFKAGHFDQEKYAWVGSKLGELADKLRQYSDDLHRPNVVGLSLWDAHQACLRWSEEPPVADKEVATIIERFGRGTGPVLDRLLELEDRCRSLVLAARTSEFGVRNGSPWALSRLTDPKADADPIFRCLEGLSAVLAADDLADLAEIAGAGSPLTPRALELVADLERANEGPELGVRPSDPDQAQEFNAIADKVVNLRIAADSVAVIDWGVTEEMLNSLIRGLEEAGLEDASSLADKASAKREEAMQLKANAASESESIVSCAESAAQKAKAQAEATAAGVEQEARTQVSKASSTASSRLESATSTKQEIGALKRKREACRNEYGSTSRWHPFRRRDLKGELDRIAEDIDEKTKDADEAVEAVTQANADKQKAETEKSDAYAEASEIRDRAAAANKETVATAKMHAAAHVNAAEAQAMALLKEADSLQAKADMAFEALTRARTEAGLHLMDAFSTLRALEAVAADLKPLQATRRRLEKLGARITVAASVTGRESLAAVLR